MVQDKMLLHGLVGYRRPFQLSDISVAWDDKADAEWTFRFLNDGKWPFHNSNIRNSDLVQSDGFGQCVHLCYVLISTTGSGFDAERTRAECRRQKKELSSTWSDFRAAA